MTEEAVHVSASLSHRLHQQKPRFGNHTHTHTLCPDCFSIFLIYLNGLLFLTNKDTFPRSSLSVEAVKCPALIKPVRTEKKNKLSDIFLFKNIKSHPVSPSPHVVVFEEAEHAQFSEDPLTGDQVLEDIGHLLQSHLSTISGVGH